MGSIMGTIASRVTAIAKPFKFVFFDIPNKIFGYLIDLARKVALAITGIGIAGGTLAVKFASDLETAIGRLQTFKTFAEGSATAIRHSLGDSAVETGQSIDDLVKSAESLGQAFKTQEEALVATRAAARAATATYSELEGITKGATTITNVYALAADKLGVAFDVIRVAQKEGRGDFSQFVAAIAAVASDARDVGLSIEQTAAMVSLLSREEESTEKAASKLSAMLKAVQRNAGALAKTMRVELISEDPVRFFRELERVSRQSGKNFTEMFGGRGDAGGSVIDFIENLGFLQEALAKTERPVSDMQLLFKNASDDVAVKMRQLGQAVKTSLAELGESLFPLIKPALDGLRDLIVSNTGRIRDFAARLGEAARLTVNLITNVAHEIENSDLMKGGLIEGIRKTVAEVITFLANSAVALAPALITAYFETGKLAGKAFLAAIKQFSADDPIPIADHIAKLEKQREEIAEHFGRGSRFQEHPRVLAIDATIKNLEILRDKWHQTDDRLLGSIELIDSAQKSFTTIMESASAALASVSVEANKSANSLFGEDSTNRIKGLFEDYATGIAGIGAAAEDTNKPLGFFTRALAQINGFLASFKLQAAALQAAAPGGGLGGSPTGTDDKRGVVITPSDESKSFAEGIRKYVEDAKNRLEDMATFAREMFRGVENIVANSFDRMFQGLIDGTFRVRDAFRDMATAILGEITRIITARAAALIVSSVATVLMPGSGAAVATASSFGNIPTGFRALLPETAMGGVFNKPQIRSIAESGTEAVVPMPDGRSIPVRLMDRGGGSAPNVTINVYANDSASFASYFDSPDVQRKFVQNMESAYSRSPLLSSMRRR